MRWFKHFTDNHRGRSIQFLLDEMGHMGPCAYFFLVELCAEKLEKNKGDVVTEADCLFNFHVRVVRQTLRISPTNLRRLLDICQTFGLLSYQISGSSLELSMPILADLLHYDQKKSGTKPNRVRKKPEPDKDKEEDKEEEYITSVTCAEAPSAAEVVPIVPRPDRGANKVVWEAYRDAYFDRYGFEPKRNAKVNSCIAQFVARLGADEAPEVARFFVQHNDAFYVKKTHSFPLALADAETLHTQWKKGRAITSNDVRRFEKNQEKASLLERIERGEL